MRRARQQLTATFVLFTLGLASLFAGLTFFVFHRVEDQMVQRRLAQMLGGEPIPVDNNPVQFVGLLSEAPAPFAARLEGAQAGRYEWNENGRESHARVEFGNSQSEATVALLSFSEQSDREWQFGLALGVGVTLASLMALLISRMMAIRIVSPIERLTQRLERLPLEEAVPEDLASSERLDEVGTLARALKRAGDDLVASASRERQFLREASHDLRTPITVIQGVADLLDTSIERDDEVNRKRLDRLARGVRRMNTTVHSLLAMARSEHRLALDEVPSFEEQLNDLLEEAQSLAAPGVVVEGQVSGELLPDGAASMLVLVLSNLVQNSIQHTNAGSVRVSVDAEAATVADTGSGLPEPLARGLEQGSAQAGFGIGLATVQRVCRRFAWSLKVDRPVAGGTLISVGLCS